MKKIKQRNIVCIGGGTGTFVALKGLKHYPVNISALVTMSDSGGSNKRIRDEFGLLPTSDIRQCFVALSDENGGVGLLRQLFMYRFEKGEGISGMTFGNLFMAALSDILGSQKEAIKQTGRVLRIHGHVIPITFTNTNLFARYEDGHVVKEEHFIDEPTHDGTLKIVDLFLKPEAEANPDALKAIEEADLLVLGPGDLYTSLIPNLLVHTIAQAMQRSKAKLVYVVNLLTKYGQTLGFSAADHVKVLERSLGKSIDFCITNTTPLPQQALKLYAKDGEYPVLDNLPRNSYYTVIASDVANTQMVTRGKSDSLIRSLIRHDSDKLASTLIGIVENT
jgi:uncharacterized cofD-like protein